MITIAGSSISTGMVSRLTRRCVLWAGRGARVRPAETAAGTPVNVATPGTPGQPGWSRTERGPGSLSPGELLIHLLGQLLDRLLAGGLALHHLLDLAVEDVRALQAAPLRRRRVHRGVVEQLLGERLALRVLEVAARLDAVRRAGQEADLRRELVQLLRLEHEVDERRAERLVLGLLELDEVRAARERRVLARRAGRRQLGPDLLLEVRLGGDDRVVGPAARDQHRDVAVRERRLRVRLLPADRRLRIEAVLVERGVVVERLGRLRRVQRRLPRVAVLRGDLPARLPD